MGQPQQAKSAPSTDQQVATMTNAEAQREHRWLQRLIGSWTYEAEAAGEPGKPATKASGSERVRSLGDVWILAEGDGEMPGGGGPAATLMTLGYDTRTKRFIGTWIGSMMTHMWVYDGELDANGRVLSLESEGPAMSGDGLGRYRDTIEFTSDNERTLTASYQGPDGKWNPFMKATYRRTAR